MKKEMVKIKEMVNKLSSFGYICDVCLGRQFTKILKGKNNREKGRFLRKTFDLGGEKGVCFMCNNFFENFQDIVKNIIKNVKKIDAKTFMFGVRLSDRVVMHEELVWEKIGTQYCESIKEEVRREVSKLIKEKTGKRYDAQKPEINIIFDMQKNDFEISTAPLFIYGEYKKYARNIPQTSSKLYKESVEDIIAKPFMKITKSTNHVFHAMGREEKEARCLAWRPFVLEIKNPLKRKFDLNSIKKKINKNKKVKVNKLRYSNKKEVAIIKAKKPYKVYRAVVIFDKPIEEIENVKKLVGEIEQRTPSRLLGFKEDRKRYKKVKSIKWKRINNKKYQFEITAESGLFLRELITGDGGRTKPSLAELLKVNASLKSFDLIGFEE